MGAADMAILAPSGLLQLINHFKGLQTLRRPQPTPDPSDDAMPDLKGHQGTGDGETRVGGRCRGRTQSSDDRTSRCRQINAGKAAAAAPALLRSEPRYAP